jgi:hypothetical protein
MAFAFISCAALTYMSATKKVNLIPVKSQEGSRPTNHNDFDMMPFFEWEFKVLPLMIKWFERASTIEMPEIFKPNIGPRKLSSIYQFVRGMPLLYVETVLRKELEDIKVAQAK